MSVSVDATGAAYVGGWLFGSPATFGNNSRATVVHLQGAYSNSTFVQQSAFIAKVRARDVRYD
jgi:hypothetical protein